MPFTTSPVDGAQLFYRDYRPASTPAPYQPKENLPQGARAVFNHSLVFLHGWPMSSAMWEHITLPLCESHRVRCVAIDRRGFGKSDWNGKADTGGVDVTYETFARDTAHVIEEELRLESFVFVGASMGCGESLLAYFQSSRLREKCKGFIWIGPSLPFSLQTPTNPKAPSRELWDTILAGIRADRASFVRVSLPGVFGAQEGGPGITIAPAVLERYERMIDQADALAIERCVQIGTSKDFTEELKRLDGDAHVPVLLLHGDSDQGMPAEASAMIVKDIVGRTDLRIYEKAAHGLYLTHAERVMGDMLGFLRSIV